ncbi:MAG TPA: hypothetical protein V6C65_37640 [Allocoleopsis sp.]
MARRKRNSATLETSERRIESLRSISEILDLGGGLTIAAYNTIISDLRTKLAAYNTALSTLDKLTDDVREAERAAKEMAEKMLLGVGSRYGKSSQEYEMAGGSRRKNNRRLTSTSESPNISSNSLKSIASTHETMNETMNGTTNGTSSAIG